LFINYIKLYRLYTYLKYKAFLTIKILCNYKLLWLGVKMVKVMIFPPNSLILADLVERKGHEVLSLQKAVRQKVKDPDIDSPPMNLTEEDPIKGLKYAAIEVPSGIRGRMSLIGPLIDEAEAAIIVDDAPFGFGCIGCARTNELSAFHLRKKQVPTLELIYPKTKDETTDMVNKINTFLNSLTLSKSDNSKNEKDTVEVKNG
jgi:putative methanogenesis marker protein 5